jgi:hypothetical protein
MLLTTKRKKSVIGCTLFSLIHICVFNGVAVGGKSSQTSYT